MWVEEFPWSASYRLMRLTVKCYDGLISHLSTVGILWIRKKINICVQNFEQCLLNKVMLTRVVTVQSYLLHTNIPVKAKLHLHLPELNVKPNTIVLQFGSSFLLHLIKLWANEPSQTNRKRKSNQKLYLYYNIKFQCLHHSTFLATLQQIIKLKWEFQFSYIITHWSQEISFEFPKTLRLVHQLSSLHWEFPFQNPPIINMHALKKLVGCWLRNPLQTGIYY